MAAISQNIPNYGIGGISEQPDQLKLKGTVKDVENAIPDVVWGLYKRPGSKRLKDIRLGDTSPAYNKKWFSYYRDATEGPYIGHIDQHGKIKMWSCLDGSEKTVKYSEFQWTTTADNYGDETATSTWSSAKKDHTAVATESVDSKATTSGDWFDYTESSTGSENWGYLATSNPKDLKTLTINDTTFLSNKIKPVRIHKNTGNQPHKFWAYIQLLKTENGRQYSFNVYDSAGDHDKKIPSATHIKIHSDDLEEGDGTGTCPGIGTQTFYVDGFSSGNSGGFFTGDDAATAGVRNVYEDADDSPPANDLVTEKFNMKGDDVTSPCAANTVHGRSNLCFKITIQGQQGQKEDKTTSDESGDMYQCSYNRQVTLLSGGEGWVKGDTCLVKFSEGHSKGGASTSAGNWTNANKAQAQFKIEVLDSEVVYHKANLRAVRPRPTPFDRDTAVSADAILGGMSKALTSGTSGELKGTHTINSSSANWDISHVVIGNGIYMYSETKEFSVDILDQDLMRVTQGDVNDVSKLPLQCRDGVVIKVTNTEQSDIDDYYVKFHASDGATGAGSWKECPAPSKWERDAGNDLVVRRFHKQLNRVTMPHIIQRQADQTFKVTKYDWVNREVGDDTTNPVPSFVSVEKDMWQHNWVNADGDTVGRFYPKDVAKTINGCAFFRNRLVLLSGENAICSQTGSVGHPSYWADTALTVSTVDAVDIACASKFPADLQAAIETPSGLLCFSNNSQFLLHSDDSSFTPDSAKFTNISNYKYNIDVPPVSLGTTIAFLDNTHNYTKVLELVNISKDQEPQIRDLTQLVPRLLSKDQNLLAVSNENNLLFVGKGKHDGASTGSNIVYVCKFFVSQDGQTKTPSWSKWVFKEPLHYFFVADNDFYFLDTDMILQKVSLVHNSSNDLFVTGKSIHDVDVEYQLNLDSWWSAGSALASSAYKPNDEPYATAPYTGYTDFGGIDSINHNTGFSTTNPGTTTNVPANFCLLDKTTGRYVAGPEHIVYYATGSTPTNGFKVRGDWTGNANLIWGWLYDYKVELPTIYPVRRAGQGQIADIKSPLTVHRMNLNFGKVGTYKTIVNKLGKDTYTEEHEQPITDLYKEGSIPYSETESKTIPIYEKNENTKVTIESTNPSPVTLHSMSWEGSYTPKFYVNQT